MSKTEKKMGITIIAILYMLVAVAGFILAILNFIPSSIYSTSLGGELWITILEPLPTIGGILGTIGDLILPYPIITVIGVVLLIVGIIMAIISIGLFKLKKWAHSLAILIAILAIVVIIGIILVWYLLKPEVKEEFGKI
ncbi:MAG: hypothetical protein GF329_06470 [Candidatus Lokiarchaeota archaeon]|nr:hypothetical protein [Candidatus Lokiarchaeota archaeon]